MKFHILAANCSRLTLSRRRMRGKFHAQYDWTTGVLDNGNEWRKFRAVPRLYPLRSLVCTLFNKGGSRGAFRLPAAGGDHFHCTVEPSPGHIRYRKVKKNGNLVSHYSATGDTISCSGGA